MSAVNLIEDDYFPVLQTFLKPNGEIVRTEMGHKKGYFETLPDGTPNHEKMIAEKPGIKIMRMPDIAEMVTKYPGFAEAFTVVQSAFVAEGKEMVAIELEAQQTPPEETPIP